MTQQWVGSSGTPISTTSYQYDANGNRTLGDNDRDREWRARIHPYHDSISIRLAKPIGRHH
jgi:predicted N-formylglutamate amidohydrolase